jgi:hypothetical protein
MLLFSMVFYSSILCGGSDSDISFTRIDLLKKVTLGYRYNKAMLPEICRYYGLLDSVPHKSCWRLYEKNKPPDGPVAKLRQPPGRFFIRLACLHDDPASIRYPGC